MRSSIALALLVAAGMLTACGSVGATGRPADAAATPETAASPSGRPMARGNPVWIDDLQMVSVDDGWALVWSSDPASGNAVLEPAVTMDGGQSWAVVTPPAAGRSLPQGQVVLDAVSGQRAWLAVGTGNANSPSSGTTSVYGTTDGGLRWSAGSPIPAATPSLLDFIGPATGWLLEDLGNAMQNEAATLWRTANGGTTWSWVAKTPPLGQPTSGSATLPTTCGKTGLAFGSAQVGWITGVCAGGYSVLVSRDGGAQWATAELPLPDPACPDGCAAAQAQFAGATTFLVIDSYPAAAVLLVSTDAGESWRTVTVPAGAGPYPRIQFFGPADAIAVSAGAQGTIGSDFYLTSDAGLSWAAVRQGRQFGSSGAQFDFVAPQAGFAWIADAAGLYRTSDAGRTWTAVVAQLG
jgi:photosystem II stability/assembly factor-like uncharacterized protein